MYNFKDTYNRLIEEASKYQCLKSVGLDEKSDVVPMTTADMDFKLADEIGEEIKKYVDSHVLGYSRITKDYLDVCLAYYKKNYNYEPKREAIVTVPGIVTALSTAVASYTKENEKVIIFTPVYPPFYEVVEMQNRKLSTCKLIDEDGNYKIDFNKLEELAKDEKAKLILLSNPHNPGSRVWTREELEKIAKIAKENNLIVVSDEIHSDVIHDGYEHVCYGNLLDGKDNSIICHAASKTYNIAGLQCSNIIIENEDLYDKFVQTNLSRGIERANVLGMVATKAAYEKAESWKEEMKKVIMENYNLLKDFFKDKKGFKLADLESSFLAWLSYKDLGISHDDFIKLIHEAKFLAADGLDYGKESEYYIRINLGLPKEKLKENLDRLEEKLKDKALI